jgi:hypothetical protein
VTLPELCDARTSRRSMELGDHGRLRELPRQRMLPPAGADQEHAHVASLSTAAPERTGSPEKSLAERPLGSVSRMDDTRFQRWLDDYVEAWRSYEREAIERLFTDDAEYRYHPWDEPVVGGAAIAADWLGDRDDPESWEAEYHPWAIDGPRAVAVGVSRYFAATGVGSTEPARSVGGGLDAAGAENDRTVEREYHNVFLCHFDDDDRCREFTELFLKRT